MKQQLYVIAYDIRSNKRRKKVSVLLENEGGERINKSVFEVALSTSTRQVLLKDITSLIDQKTDQIACYPICRSCYTRSEYIPEPLRDVTGKIIVA